MIHDLPIWQMGLLVIGSLVGLTLVGIRQVNRRWPVTDRHAHNDIAGFIIAVVGVLYAVLLASIAVMAMDNLSSAEAAVQQEADVLGDLYRNAAFLPEPTSGALRTELRAYGRVAVEAEWPLMKRGVRPEEGWESLERLGALIRRFEPRAKLEEIAAATYMADVDALYDARRDRILLAFKGLEPVAWWIILLGAGATLVFCLFFGVASVRAHMAMAGLLAFSLGLVLVLIIAVDQPLRGRSQVSSEPFAYVLHQMDRLDAGER